MIVRCKSNELASIGDKSALGIIKEDVHLETVCLEVGRLYCVFGLSLANNVVRYLICTNERDWYPTPHYADFFEVVDNEIPSDWVFVEESGNLGKNAILPRAWSLDSRFLEKLVDGDIAAVAEFSDMKEHSKAKLEALRS